MMRLKVTKTATPRRTENVELFAANLTNDLCACTITAKYEAMGGGDILSLRHFPRTVVLTRYIER